MEKAPDRYTLFDRVIDAAAILAGVLFVYSTVGTCVEVILRYFFLRPTNWILETNEYILYIAPFLAAAWVLKEDGHVKMDLLVASLSARNQALLNTFTALIGIVVCLIIVWFGAVTTIDSFRTDYITSSGYIRINRGYFLMVGVVGCLLLAIQFARKAMAHLRQIKSGTVSLAEKDTTFEGV